MVRALLVRASYMRRPVTWTAFQRTQVLVPPPFHLFRRAKVPSEFRTDRAEWVL